MNKVLFSSQSCHWSTPEALYRELDREFHFTFDPCPLHGTGGLTRAWGKRNFVNPPYCGQIFSWMEKGVSESKKGKLVVFLLPARTDTKWFQDLALPYAREIRFIRGRLKFGGAKHSAPFPSVIVVFSL